MSEAPELECVDGLGVLLSVDNFDSGALLCHNNSYIQICT